LDSLAILEGGRCEQVKCQSTVVATIQRAVENLLDDVVHHIMKKVVPWEAEKKVLIRSAPINPPRPSLTTKTYKNSWHNLVLHELNLEKVTHDWASIELGVIRCTISISWRRILAL
jgi:hypothetical protein